MTPAPARPPSSLGGESHSDSPRAGAAFVIELTAYDGTEFQRPKYWTGKMLEHWPEYLANVARAHRFEDKISAGETLAGFRARGFSGRVVRA